MIGVTNTLPLSREPGGSNCRCVYDSRIRPATRTEHFDTVLTGENPGREPSIATTFTTTLVHTRAH